MIKTIHFQFDSLFSVIASLKWNFVAFFPFQIAWLTELHAIPIESVRNTQHYVYNNPNWCVISTNFRLFPPDVFDDGSGVVIIQV